MSIEYVILAVGCVLAAFGYFAVSNANRTIKKAIDAWGRARRARIAADTLFHEAIDRGDPEKIADSINRYFATFNEPKA